jgi:alkanesulfonate monooxygenase SsuD/methylene tetrahydromethanopterin reductase-like flavin-dependent oxidoreductase (luciferase family)
MKKIGFLSFGHWSNHPAYNARTASDTLLQSIDLAVAAEEIASPFPLLAAVGAKTSKIEIGTGVIDMRYENPLYMVEDASAADLISEGRLQLGISRGSPEQVIDGWRYFGYELAEGETDADMGRRKALEFLDKLKGLIHIRCSLTRRVYCVWNHIQKDYASASGGELLLMQPLCGRPSRECICKARL